MNEKNEVQVQKPSYYGDIPIGYTIIA